MVEEAAVVMGIIEVGGEKENQTFTAVVAIKKVNVQWIEQGGEKKRKRKRSDKKLKVVDQQVSDNYSLKLETTNLFDIIHHTGYSTEIPLLVLHSRVRHIHTIKY